MKLRILTALGAVIALLALAPVALAADTAPDPANARAILEGLFTLQGGAVGATLIAAFIEGLKAAGGVGAWLEAGREGVVAFILSILLVVFAVVALGKPLDLVSDFGYVIAWLALAKLAGGMYDAVHETKKALTKS